MAAVAATMAEAAAWLSLGSEEEGVLVSLSDHRRTDMCPLLPPAWPKRKRWLPKSCFQQGQRCANDGRWMTLTSLKKMHSLSSSWMTAGPWKAVGFLSRFVSSYSAAAYYCLAGGQLVAIRASSPSLWLPGLPYLLLKLMPSEQNSCSLESRLDVSTLLWQAPRRQTSKVAYPEI